MPINAAGLVYCFYILIWIAWPGAPNPTKETFNWSSVMFVAVMLISTVFYVTSGKTTYAGPVTLVRKL